MTFVICWGGGGGGRGGGGGGGGVIGEGLLSFPPFFAGKNSLQMVTSLSGV